MGRVKTEEFISCRGDEYCKTTGRRGRITGLLFCIEFGDAINAGGGLVTLKGGERGGDMFLLGTIRGEVFGGLTTLTFLPEKSSTVFPFSI